MKRWNKEEERYLINNYKNMTYRDIAIYLNRSENSIKKKSDRLKLYKDDRYSKNDEIFLKRKL